MCWYCRTSRGPWEDEQQVAVSRGEGARASDTNDVGDDVELEDLSSSSGLPKRFAASGVIDIQAAAGLERPDIALPHSHTATQPHSCTVAP